MGSQRSVTNIFNSVPGPTIPYSTHDLSYNKLFDAQFGNLYPVQVDEVVPGDVWSQAERVSVRPIEGALHNPLFHDINIELYSFHVPYRILMGRVKMFDTPVGEADFDDLITGGRDGNIHATVPVWDYNFNRERGGLGDYMGIPIYSPVKPVATSVQPVIFPWRAYRYIYNCFFRDENLEDEIDVVPSKFSDYDELLTACWSKDYFTSALPFQQRGTAPAIPLSGFAPVEASSVEWLKNDSDGKASLLRAINSDSHWFNSPSGQTAGNYVPDSNKVRTVFSGSDAQVTVEYLRNTLTIQHVFERAAVTGARYTEYLMGFFGVSPRDDTLQRPLFLGGTRFPLQISEVTSHDSGVSGGDGQKSNPLGVQGATFGAYGSAGMFKYRVKEYGLIMTLMVIRPKPTYRDQMNRQWIKNDRWSFYLPQLANLSEDAIRNYEVKYDPLQQDTVKEKGIFGYTGIWNHMRCKHDLVVGNIADPSKVNYIGWTMARMFSGYPLLNKEFLHINPNSDYLKAPFTYVDKDNPPFAVSCFNAITAVRPIPYYATPGLTRV